jgi:hypothetical protein
MTRKDYKLLAAVFAKSKPTLEDFTTTSAVGDNTFTDHIKYDAAYAQWSKDVIATCNALEEVNPRFSRSVFQYLATAPITINLRGNK